MIFNFEKKTLDWMHEHILGLSFTVALFISLIIRFFLKDFFTSDAEWCLIPWYEAIKNNGGIRGLAVPVEGLNYSFTYQFFIAIMTYLPIQPLYAYKILSCIFDYLLAGTVAYIVYDIVDSKKQEKALLAFILVACSPVVLMDSAAWAQCDSIYTFWVVLAIALLRKENYKYSFIALGVAFAFKFQAVFTLPFFIFYYFYKKKFSLLYFGFIPFCMVVLSLPSLLQGRTISEMIHIYTDNTSLHTSIANGYPSFWRMLNDGTGADSYMDLKQAAMALTVIVLGCFVFMWVRQSIKLDATTLTTVAFIMTYSTVFFLPAMHERYGYVYEILAIIIAFMAYQTIPLLIGLNCISLFTYGVFLFSNTVNEWLFSTINLVIYVAYMIILNKALIQKSNS